MCLVRDGRSTCVFVRRSKPRHGGPSSPTILQMTTTSQRRGGHTMTGLCWVRPNTPTERTPRHSIAMILCAMTPLVTAVKLGLRQPLGERHGPVPDTHVALPRAPPHSSQTRYVCPTGGGGRPPRSRPEAEQSPLRAPRVACQSRPQHEHEFPGMSLHPHTRPAATTNTRTPQEPVGPLPPLHL